MVRSIEYIEEYDSLVKKGSVAGKKSKITNAERMLILEYLRRTRLYQPDVACKHGCALLSEWSGKRLLGDEIWAVYEQVCVASLQLGLMGWSAHCVEALLEKFPTSKRVKRIYAQYREAVGEWDEALTIYNDMIKENPESTFPRKRKIAILKQQGETSKAVEAMNEYLELFQTDREIWSELGHTYIENACLTKAAFCFEELIMHDVRNLYALLTYAELLAAQGEKHFENARKYYCLACEVDESNPRALWGLATINLQMVKRDTTSERMQMLQKFTLARLRKLYKGSGKGGKKKKNEGDAGESGVVMLELVEEIATTYGDSVFGKGNPKTIEF